MKTEVDARHDTPVNEIPTIEPHDEVDEPSCQEEDDRYFACVTLFGELSDDPEFMRTFEKTLDQSSGDHSTGLHIYKNVRHVSAELRMPLLEAIHPAGEVNENEILSRTIAALFSRTEVFGYLIWKTLIANPLIKAKYSNKIVQMTENIRLLRLKVGLKHI